MSDDAQRIGRLRRGEQAALRAIYEEYKDDLLTIAACLLSDVPAAEDCLHDVFVNFAARIRQLRLRGSLKAYLAASVANQARDQLRRKARRHVSLDDVAEPAADPPGPAAQLADCEELQNIHQALAKLPYEQREAIILHLHGPMTFAEVARHQRVSINTAQSRYRYGLDKLRSLLNTGVRR